MRAVNGTPTLTNTDSYTVTVSDVTSAPSLTLPANLTIAELALWTTNASATDKIGRASCRERVLCSG